ncbi:uncharacterized protein BDZ99DRAFT_496536 [Mytilinidion resinicola]|uniref:Uncharacterized protein n=1 Tax=Mytilinidion resinicola TaxID=574789 RepID=A0A6A6YXM4_9PEZI|nr:uncharacterized protein BDZ99DRAFT_496536 [Mytilinidion resinicola]KAF2813581.1 hypothetical protein BDZ99DRAFT_496536 [Mytilinidion resinicola]
MSTIRDLDTRSVAKMFKITKSAIRKCNQLVDTTAETAGRGITSVQARFRLKESIEKYWIAECDHHFDVYLEGRLRSPKHLSLVPSDSSKPSYDIYFKDAKSIRVDRKDGETLANATICAGTIGSLIPDGTNRLGAYMIDIIPDMLTSDRPLSLSPAPHCPFQWFVWTRAELGMFDGMVHNVGLLFGPNAALNPWAGFHNKMPKIAIHKRSKVGILKVAKGDMRPEVEDIVVATCMAVLKEGEPGWKRLGGWSSPYQRSAAFYCTLPTPGVKRNHLFHIQYPSEHRPVLIMMIRLSCVPAHGQDVSRLTTKDGTAVDVGAYGPTTYLDAVVGERAARDLAKSRDSHVSSPMFSYKASRILRPYGQHEGLCGSLGSKQETPSRYVAPSTGTGKSFHGLGRWRKLLTVRVQQATFLGIVRKTTTKMLYVRSVHPRIWCSSSPSTSATRFLYSESLKTFVVMLLRHPGLPVDVVDPLHIVLTIIITIQYRSRQSKLPTHDRAESNVSVSPQ